MEFAGVPLEWGWRRAAGFANFGKLIRGFVTPVPQVAKVIPAVKQAIAGVSPSEVSEANIMTVWPSVSAYSLGRFLGRLYDIRFPNLNRVMRVGNLIALATSPIALILYLYKLLPRVGIRYVLTNRRVVVQRGLEATDHRSVALDNFDDIKIAVQPGQEWFKAGDLISQRRA